MTKSPTPTSLSFTSTLERLAEGIEYYAVPVPAKITAALGTKGPVPVMAAINGTEPFAVSLHPQGGGRHGMRVKAAVRKAAGIGEGDRVKVEITVGDPSAEIEIPAEIAEALRVEGALQAFKALPNGRKRYLIRWINEAAKSETRDKRVIKVATEARDAS